ncbi:MAG: hypothetical protein JW993_17095 [Sedimentisphaerales bacterium]|nr:hypothetical protein [Sedimentisphaerales bacterium]
MASSKRHLTAAVLAFFTWALCARTAAVEFAGGTGEPNDPYLIATAEQFLTADFTVPETYFRLCNDIDLDRKAGPLTYFRAHLDGAGFEIRNAISSRAGVFGGVMAGASIRNLVVADVDVVTTALPDYPGSMLAAGGFAAENFGIIENCGVTGVVVTWRVGTVGGFVGGNAGAIINCYFDGWVIAPWEDKVEGDELESAYVGGLVSVNGENGLIANSLAWATVLGNRGVGGLVGRNAGTIRNCYARGPVVGQVGAGGLVSENTGHLQTCYAASLVTGEMRGGLVSLAGGGILGSVSNCVWDWTDTDCHWSGAGIGVHGIRGGG